MLRLLLNYILLWKPNNSFIHEIDREHCGQSSGYTVLFNTVWTNEDLIIITSGPGSCGSPPESVLELGSRAGTCTGKESFSGLPAPPGGAEDPPLHRGL